MLENKTIIAIGAGRSGSTLLTRIFNMHPDIKFGGETDFLAPRLWGEMWENRFWFHWKMQVESEPNSAISRKDDRTIFNLRTEIDFDISPQVEEQARRDVSGMIQSSIKKMLGLEQSRVWGYKEPWNGSSSFLYDWKIYDIIFPEAVWLHLIRNPFTYAKSCSQWVRHDLDMNFLTNQLNEWIQVVKYSRQRNTTGRYYEIRYEDLIHAPKSTLQPVFDACGLEWVENCEAALQNSVMKSSKSTPKSDSLSLTLDHVNALFEQIEGLKELCNDLNYVPEMDIQNYFVSYKKEAEATKWKKNELNIRNLEHEAESARATAAREAELARAAAVREAELTQAAAMREAELTQAAAMRETELLEYIKTYAMAGENGLKRIHLVTPFQQEVGFSWVINLDKFEESADNLEHPNRSTLLLFENDTLLQPAHSLHEDICNLGGGRYSHWGNTLYFSTSDGSDPNENLRDYWLVLISKKPRAHRAHHRE